MIPAGRDDELPIVKGSKAGCDRLELLCIDLADVFGVSTEFIQVRLRKYRLISEA
jgi:hypothetical protein